MNRPNKFTLITCNNILCHLCTNANNIASIQIITGKISPTSLEIEQYLNDSLDYLFANQFVVKITSKGRVHYKITDNGMAFTGMEDLKYIGGNMALY